jgi:excinuclease ABC subunit B
MSLLSQFLSSKELKIAKSLLLENKLEEILRQLKKRNLKPNEAFEKTNYLIEKQSKKLIKKTELTIAQAIIRPTGLLDPIILIKPVNNQVEDVLEQVRQRVIKGQRVLITALTKKFAEELDIYFKQINVKSAYIHSDVDTLERVEILSDLRRGKYDVLVGINLLREGLDLPEVSLVAIFDADKEGFLRSKTSLIQIIGRAARHQEGTVIMYADKITASMQYALDETERRRNLQILYNQKHHITPKSTQRELQNIVEDLREEINKNDQFGEADAIWMPTGFEKNSKKGRGRPNKQDKSNKRGKQLYADFDAQKEEFLIELKKLNLTQMELKNKMQNAIDNMQFEEAAAIRDLLK